MVFCNDNTKEPLSGIFHCHNPYFNRWFSAIETTNREYCFCYSHNPYFNRWFSAINPPEEEVCFDSVTILILIDGFLQ